MPSSSSIVNHSTEDAASGFVVPQEVLDRLGDRAPGYDSEARFFHEDLEELRELGYLALNVPVSLGGHGRTLLDTAREQRRLAYRSTSTALGINMHLYWTGAAADRHRAGDSSLDWVLEEAAAGRLFASGHGERGNDLALEDSTTRAEPQPDGGYRFTGRKIFGSLSPAWDWFGLHGRDDSDPDLPKIVHAFIRRDADGIHIEETWDTVGLRATRSEDTHLDGVVAAPAEVARVLPIGPPAIDDPFVLSLFAWAQVGIGSVYHGLGQRAFDVAVEHARSRASRKLGGRPSAEDPYVQAQIAEIALQLELLQALVERTAGDWSAGVEHGQRWPAKLVATKHHSVEASRRIVELATLIVGGASLFNTHELSRIYRDVLGGAFHPVNGNGTQAVLAATALDIAATGQTPSGAHTAEHAGDIEPGSADS
jgi:alkylation response protein AidB-like acyl-CoA dehydrogenase